MPRRLGDAADRVQGAQRYGGRQDTPAAALPAAPLSLAKRRIAQALAALLVAHYRRQQDPKGDRAPGA